MGLDFIKLKEENGKELFSEFSKSMMSNVYNSEELKNEIETSNTSITELDKKNVELNKKIVEVQERIIKGQQYRDSLLKNKHTDIDKEISLLQPTKLELEINELKIKKNELEKQSKEVKVIEPSSYYYEDQHDKIKENYQEVLKSKIQIEMSIDNIEKLQKSVSGGIKCEHCGIELMNAAITQSKISELARFYHYKDEISELMRDLSNKEQTFTKLKKSLTSTKKTN